MMTRHAHNLPQGPRLSMATALAALLALTAGCGGPDLGGNSGSRNGLFDQGLSGNYSGYGQSNGRSGTPTSGTRGRGTYARVEASFELGDIQGNPFDFNENDVVVTVTTSDNKSVRIPAFFDGGKTWRVRYTPEVTGRHTITKVTNNGHDVQPEKFDKREFDVNGSAQPGFVRRDTKDKTRFAFDNGNSYYPIGHNVAVGDPKAASEAAAAPKPKSAPQTGKPEVPAAGPNKTAKDIAKENLIPSREQNATAPPVSSSSHASDYAATFEKMNKAGENWSRVWMTHHDGKSLDWPAGGKPVVGQFDLAAAQRMDAIVEAAEKSGIYLQVVLQDATELSTRGESSWDKHPWNKKNGGFLTSPDEFFSNPRAIALTKAKYRYIAARWGASPAVMAWELFNEVENTDAVYHKHQDEVASWHAGMTTFLRQQDPNKHLVTSSSGTDVATLGRDLDFFQLHASSADAVTSAASLDLRKLDRPVFFGEVGHDASAKDAAAGLHRALWGSVMSEMAGAAQLESADAVEKQDLYTQFKPAADFVRQSGLISRRNLLATAPGLETSERSTLTFSPGAGNVTTKQTEFTVLPSGAVEGLAAMPAYLQGSAHREMFPSATLKATYPAPGTFAVTLGKVSKAGAHVVLTVDGVQVAEKKFAPAEKDAAVDATLETKVAAGAHTIKLENSGEDWVTLKSFTLTPYAPAIGAVGKAGKDYAAYWLYNRGTSDQEVKGKLTVPGIQSGSYKVTWYDTTAGKTLSEATATAAAGGLTVETPSFGKDVAVYITKSNDRSAANPSNSKKAKGLQ